MILKQEILSKVISELKSQGKQIVFTNGCFDILHAGHVTYLSKAAKLGDILVIGLNSDNSVKRLKGESRPINNEDDRALVLSALEFVDFVVMFSDYTPKALIEAITPDVLVKGGDYIPENVVGAEHVINSGGRVEIIPLLEGRSTTSIINKMK